MKTTEERINCLRLVDAQVLTNQEVSVAPYSLNMEPFPPTVDGKFLVEQPSDLISSSLFKKSSVLLGTDANEGVHSLMEFLPDLSFQSDRLELSSEQLDSAMARMFSSFSLSLNNLIKFQYGMFETEDENGTGMGRFFGLQSAVSDKEVVCKVDKLAKKVARDDNKVRLLIPSCFILILCQVFRYFFNPNVEDLLKPTLNYVLGQPLHSLGRSRAGLDKEVSKKMIQLWSNFVKHGDPNEKDAGDKDSIWPVFQGPDWKYLHIEGDKESIKQKMRGSLCTFWDEIVPGFTDRAEKVMASARSDKISDQTCRRVRTTARLYFPGYRAMVRL